MQDVSGEDGLNDVCAVQAVHTVGTQDAFLAVLADDVAAACGFLLDVVVAVVAELTGQHVD
jgi:hypothetical protein